MENLLLIHSKCHDAHWKLCYDKEINNLLLLCCICNEALAADVSFINPKAYIIIPCKCGCGNHSYMSECCGNFWELIYDRLLKKTWLVCESCEAENNDIKINLNFAPQLCDKCERIN